MLSSHPTVIDGRLEPRHVDLRPFVFVGPDGAAVAPGGLTRGRAGARRARREQLAARRRKGHVGPVVSPPPLVWRIHFRGALGGRP